MILHLRDWPFSFRRGFGQGKNYLDVDHYFLYIVSERIGCDQDKGRNEDFL
jgi:hypothetical protein